MKVNASGSFISYRKHDIELRKLVEQTGDIHYATSRGVPRTTAQYWAKHSKSLPKQNQGMESLLNLEIQNLKKELERERAKNQFLREVAVYLPDIKDNKKRVSKTVKKVIVKKVEEYKKFSTIKDLLSVMSLQYPRYLRWRADIAGCEKSKNSLCKKRKINQLTEHEVSQIFKLATSKKFEHYSLNALWKYAYRNAIVVCSVDTWYKYIKLLGVQRRERSMIKNDYLIGVRALAPNQIWHLDITYLKLKSGKNVYLQVLIDNYSRYIVNWKLFEDRTADNTVELLHEARLGKFETKVYMDSGVENKNKKVGRLFVGKNVKRVLAKVDVRYSNSMVEAFFRSLKNNFLKNKSFETLRGLKKGIEFYVQEYNYRIPHNCFQFASPSEIYNECWNSKNDREILKKGVVAQNERRKINYQMILCRSCPS